MRKLMVLALFALFASNPVFAGDPDEATSPDCETIAKACLDAGFTEHSGQGKTFWHDCMKPVLFGKEVSGVTVDAKVVKSCRQFKIKNMQQQIEQLKNVKSK